MSMHRDPRFWTPIMAARKHAPIYATLRRRFTTTALLQLGFAREGSSMVRRGLCRSLKATASSLDGTWWRVTPLTRHRR
jgi:hypothetical protein